MQVMLDTNICIYIIKQKPEVVLQRFRAFQVGDIGISAITLAELQYGAAKSARPRQPQIAFPFGNSLPKSVSAAASARP
jgi:tRNA(fMet)-specific endonuclease VapC